MARRSSWAAGSGAVPLSCHRYARGARHFALARARSFALLFQFGMLRLVFGLTQVFFVSFAMSCSGWSVKSRH